MVVVDIMKKWVPKKEREGEEMFAEEMRELILPYILGRMNFLTSSLALLLSNISSEKGEPNWQRKRQFPPRKPAKEPA